MNRFYNISSINNSSNINWIFLVLALSLRKYTDRLSHLFCQEFITNGYFLPHFSSRFKSSSSATSLFGAWYISFKSLANSFSQRECKHRLFRSYILYRVSNLSSLRCGIPLRYMMNYTKLHLSFRKYWVYSFRKAF